MATRAGNDNKFKAIDFFCGGGGMTCGLRQAGIDVIAIIHFIINASSEHTKYLKVFYE